MSLETVAIDRMLDALGIDAVSLHDADPGATGAAELVGGTYARQTPAWDPAAAGALDLASSLTFDVPSGSTVAFYGLWKAGVWQGSVDPTPDETYGADGTYTINSLSVTGS